MVLLSNLTTAPQPLQLCRRGCLLEAKIGRSPFRIARLDAAIAGDHAPSGGRNSVGYCLGRKYSFGHYPSPVVGYNFVVISWLSQIWSYQMPRQSLCLHRNMILLHATGRLREAPLIPVQNIPDQTKRPPKTVGLEMPENLSLISATFRGGSTRRIVDLRDLMIRKAEDCAGFVGRLT